MTRFQKRRFAGTRLTSPEKRERIQLQDKVTIHSARRYEQVATMIVRKTQRVEDRAFASRFGTRQAAVILPPEMQLTHSRGSQRLEREAVREPTKAPAPVSPVVSVTALTDEVMKHLDRRLVAAMERLGKT